MKKYIKHNKIWLISGLKRFISGFVCCAMILNALPTYAYADEINKLLTSIADSFTQVKTEPVKENNIITKIKEPETYIYNTLKDAGLTAENETILINSAAQFSKLCQTNPSEYQNLTIEFATIGTSNLEVPDGYGLGNANFPFGGKISYTESPPFNLKSPLFFAIYDSVDIPAGGIKLASIEDNKNPLFAEVVLHKMSTEDESTNDNPKTWKITVTNVATEDVQKNKNYGGIIGTLGDNENSAKIDLDVTIDTTGKIESDSNAGIICGEISKGSELSFKYSGTENLSVTSKGGMAGGFVGSMAEGSKLTVNSDITFSGSVTAGASGNAGGIVGSSLGTVTIADSKIVTVKAANIKGQNAGGYIGNMTLPETATTDSDISLDKVKIENANITATLTCAGGLIGALENNTADKKITIGANTTPTAANITATLSGTDIGGVIGSYNAARLESTLEISNVNADITASGTEKVGGVIGALNGTNGAYAKIENATANINGTTAEYFGGIIGLADGGSFADISNVKVTAKNFNGTKGGGGIVGYFGNGVLKLSGTTDLSGANPQLTAQNGQLVGERDNTLIYSEGSGEDAKWTLTRCGGVPVSDVATWGSVYRSADLTNVLTEDLSAHTVTIGSPTTTIGSKEDFVKTALNIQLNSGGYGALQFADITKKMADLLKTDLSLSADIDAIDLTGTGMVGLTRDNNSQVYTGTFDGGEKTLKLAVGESYGKNSDGSPADGVGSGQIYNHTHNGLFAQLSGNVKDLNLEGVMNIGNTVTNTNVYAGGLAAETDGGKDVIISNCNFNQTMTDYSEKGFTYVGGAVGNINANTTFTNVTSSAVIEDNKDNKDTYMGGVVGIIANSKPATFNNVTVGGSITSIQTDDAKIGGLIACASGSNIKINGVTVNNAMTSTAAKGTSGGFLGYAWDKTDVAFGETGGLNVGGTLTTTAKNAAGLCYQATGYWQIGDNENSKIMIGGSISAANAESFGMIANKGTDNTNGIYLEVADLSSYKIEGYTLTLPTNIAVFDEFVAYTTLNNHANGQNGVISLPTTDGNPVSMDDTGATCNTYQNRTEYGKTGKVSPFSRYYYNIDKIRTKKSAGAEQLMLWSLKNYAAPNIQSKFIGGFSNENIGDASTPIDLNGYSYYPIDVPEGGATVNNAQITFYNKQINDAEGLSGGDGYARTTTDGANQHYLMHHGLFRNVDADVELTVSGTNTLSGSIGLSTVDGEEGSGALVCGKVEGNSVNVNIYKATLTMSGKTTLTDLYVVGADTSSIAPLLINKICKYSNVSIIGVKTAKSEDKATYDMGGQKHAATSLIGDANGLAMSITFSKIALDSRKEGASLSTDSDLKIAYGTEKSIFREATLLNSFVYDAEKDKATLGRYDFTYDEDWNSDPLHQVTYGKEISETEENKKDGVSQQNKYYKDSHYVSPTDNNKTVKPDSFSEGYLPYVAKSLATGYNTTNLHEIKVNIFSTSITKGCGTYGDPYEIEDQDHLIFLQNVLLLDKPFDQDYEIGYTSLDSSTPCQNDNHAVYIYNGSVFKLKSGTGDDKSAKEISVSDMKEHFRDGYYEITKDFTIDSDKFYGIGYSGSENKTVRFFRGVIVGDKHTTITITNATDKPLIQNAAGCVVKDLNITYTNSFTIKKTVKRTFSTTGFTEEYKSFGGVIAVVAGGDNIIDNVNVSFTEGKTISLGGKYAKLIPVGGYVGVCLNGGLVFRNMPDKEKLTFDTIAQLNDKDFYYVNPYVGRVLDSYAVYETDNNFGNSTVMDNSVTITKDGKTEKVYKNYCIPDIYKPKPTEDNKKISMTRYEGGESTATGYSKVTIPDDQSMYILSILSSSGACAYSFDSDNNRYDSNHWNNKGTGTYFDSTAYEYGRTRLADYSDIGTETETDDFKLSQKDSSKNGNDKIPYLIYYFTKPNNTNAGNDNWIARSLCGMYTRFSFELTDDNYILPTAFSGFNALYFSSFGTTENHRDRNTIFTYGFYGNDATIHQEIDITTYYDDDYPVSGYSGVGFFNNITQSPNGHLTTNMKDKGTDEKVYDDYLKGKDSTTGEKTRREKFTFCNFTLTGHVILKEDLNAASGTTVETARSSVGGLFGAPYKKAQYYHIYVDGVILKNLEVSGGFYTGGIIGRTTDNYVYNLRLKDVEATKLTVKSDYGKNVGGLVGRLEHFYNNSHNIVIDGKDDGTEFNIKEIKSAGSAGGLVGNYQKETNNFTNPLVISNMNISGYNNDGKLSGTNHNGGMVGYSENAASVSIDNCSVKYFTLSGAKTNGGMLGYCHLPATIQNSYVSNCNFLSTSNDSANGGLVGNSYAVKGFNLLVNNNTFNDTGTRGNWIGNSNSWNSIQLVGISKSNSELNDIGSGKSANDYFIYNDYNLTCTTDKNPTDYNQTPSSTTGEYPPSKSPYVIVNPALKVGNKYFTSDGFGWDGTQSTAKQIATSPGKYKAITNIATKFTTGDYKDKLTTYKAADDKAEYTGDDFPVLLVDTTDFTEITELIKSYISLVTNFNQTETNKYDDAVTITTYNLKEDKKPDGSLASLTYQNGNFYVTPGKYDNEKNQFTVVTVKFESPITAAGNTKTKEYYCLNIPILVKKVLEFNFDATVVPGTNYYDLAYEGRTSHVMESFGTPVTALMTYTYYREAKDWQAAINNGENLMWNFPKSVILGALELSSKLPDDTQLILVDKSRKGKSYTATLGTDISLEQYGGTSHKLSFSGFKDADSTPFKPVSIMDLMLEQYDVTATEDSGDFVIDKDTPTVKAKLNGEVTGFRKAGAGETGKYSITVSGTSDLTESYYLTIKTPNISELNNTASIVNNFMVYNIPLENPSDGGGVPTMFKKLGNQEVNDDSENTEKTNNKNTYVLGNFFKHTMKVEAITENTAMDITNNELEVKMTANISIKDVDTFQKYSTGLKIYHEFALYLEKYIDGIRESDRIDGTTKVTSYTYNVNDKDIKIDPLPIDKPIDYYYVSGKEENETDPYNLLNDILYTDENGVYKGATIVANVTLEYTDTGIVDQFPENKNATVESGSEKPTGIKVNANSNISLNDDTTLHTTTVKEHADDKDKYYYRVINLGAKLHYNAYKQITFGTGEDITQLGINAREDESPVQIKASATYDIGDVADAINKLNPKKIRFTLSLERKQEKGKYIGIDKLSDYFSGDVILTPADNTGQSALRLPVSEGPTMQFEFDWWKQSSEEGSNNTTFDVTTLYDVITGEDFEVKGHIYANYKVKITAELIDDKGKVIENSKAEDYIIYTNAKIYTSIIPRNTNSQ